MGCCGYSDGLRSSEGRRGEGDWVGMKRGNQSGTAGEPAFCRWVDVIGRNPAQLERVRKRLSLPPRLVSLSLVEHLQPVVIRVRPAWFLATYFTIPSQRSVFARHPLFLWLADYAIVTVSPWAQQYSVVGATGELDQTRDEFLCRIVEAAVSSHEEVGRQLHEAFFVGNRAENPHAWHRKERRVALFEQLLDHQLEFLRAVGTAHPRIRQVHEQLAGLVQIARFANRKLRESAHCRVCRHDEVIGRRQDSQPVNSP
jgi:hypothetical protein